MSIWTAVSGLSNGEALEDSVLNRPLFELRERTDYLYALLASFAGTNPFEAIRLSSLELETTGDSAPLLKDIVYLNPTTHKLEKAIATLDVFNNIFTASNIQALAIGVLVDVVGTLGTVAIFGRTYLTSNTGTWDVVDMVQSDESFRPGQYYLSSTEAGKITATPKGPAIYLGQFLAQVSDPTVLDYAVLMPQYKDVAESHIHRSIVLETQPAGSQVYVKDPISGTHTIYGFMPQSNADVTDGSHTGGMAAAVMTDATATFVTNNLIGLTLTNVTQGTSSTITANTGTTITTTVGLGWNTNDTYKISERNRLIITGTWADVTPVQYTFILGGASSTTPPVTGTTGFDTVYLYWTSTDPNEASGSVQIRSYETAVSVGTKGIKAILENVLTDWDKVEECGEKRRKWVIDVPEQTKGWLANKQRGYFTDHFVGTDLKYSLVILSGPHTSSDDRLTDTLTIKAGHLYRIVYGTTMPVDGELVTVDTTVFEFDDDDTLASPTNVKVTIVPADVNGSFSALLSAINEALLSGTTAIINEDVGHLIIGVANATSVTTTLGAPITLTEIVAAGAWAIGGTNGFMVYDSLYKALVPTTSYWSGVNYWEPVTLNNGLSIMFIPYDSDGTVSTADTVVNGDNWTKAIIDEAPSANFMYNVGMHQELAIAYPPIPFDCGLLILNGIELENKALFTDSLTYKFGNTGIYWYKNNYPYVPWPQDWVSTTSAGSAEYVQYMAYHNVRMSIGNSSIVTSLQPALNSPIKITKCGTSDPATTGDLSIDLDLQLTEVNTAMEGYEVYKAIASNKLVKGPVVSQIEAGPGIQIISPPGVAQGRGRVRIGLSSGTGLTGEFEECALENAKQEQLGLYPYIKLLNWTTGGTNINTGFVAKFKVPVTTSGNYKVLIYLTMFGESDVLMPVGVTPSLKYAGLDIYYSILHDYLTPTGLNPNDNLVDDLVTPLSTRHIEVPMGSLTGPTYIYKAYDPIIINNNPNEVSTLGRITQSLGDPIPTIADIQHGTVIDPALAYVTAGSLVAIRIRRAGVTVPANEYTGALGMLNIAWRLL